MKQTPRGQSVCAPSGKLQWVGRQCRCLPQPQEHNRTGRDPGDKGEGRGCAAPRAIRVLWVHYHCKATCGYSSPCPMGSAHGHRLCCETPGQSAAPPPRQHRAGLGCRYLGLRGHPRSRFAVHPTFRTPFPRSWLCRSSSASYRAFVQHRTEVQPVQQGNANGHLAAAHAQGRWATHSSYSNLWPGATTAAHNPYLKVRHVHIPPAPITLTIYRCPYTFLIKTLLHIHNHILNYQEQ